MHQENTQSRHSFVGGRVASLSGLAKLRPTFEVHNFCRFQSLNDILIVHSMQELVATETITLVNS